MEDRFRFRFFDNTIEYMGDVESLSIQSDWAMVRFSYADEETPDDEVELSRGVLMQCSGLKDKNGKLIYEGDVIKHFFNKKLQPDVFDLRQVVFGLSHDEGGVFRESLGFHRVRLGFKLGSTICCSSPVHYGLDKCEIIGNIHEHKNLLEKKFINKKFINKK